MDLFKRNIGFWMFIAAATVGAVVLAILILRMNQTLGEREATMGATVQEMARLERSPLAINRDNIDVATGNREKAEGEFQRLRNSLAGTYGFPPVPAMEPLKCKSEIASKLTLIGSRLRSRGVTLSDNPADFSLASVRSNEIPTPEEVPLLWRQAILLGDLAEAIFTNPGITRLSRASRLRGDLTPIPGPLYDIMPLDIQVTGTYNGILTLINQLQGKRANRFYIVRTCALQATDQAAGNTLPKLKLDKEKTAPRTSFAKGPTAGPGQPARPGAAGDKLSLELTKDERVLFEPSEITATMVVDCVEFKNPAEEK